jgi:hypothetical protein
MNDLLSNSFIQRFPFRVHLYLFIRDLILHGVQIQVGPTQISDKLVSLYFLPYFHHNKIVHFHRIVEEFSSLNYDFPYDFEALQKDNWLLYHSITRFGYHPQLMTYIYDDDVNQLSTLLVTHSFEINDPLDY